MAAIDTSSEATYHGPEDAQARPHAARRPMRVGVLGRVAVRNTIRLDLVASLHVKGFIVRIEAGRPAYTGPGPANYACGRCGAILCEGVRPGILAAVTFHCSCGEFNRIPKALAPSGFDP